MCSFESLAAVALLGSESDQKLARVRLAVKNAVVLRLVCECGVPLDQSDAVLLSEGSQADRHGKALALLCPSCFDSLPADNIQRSAFASRRGLFACTWNGETQLGGEQ